MMPGATPRAIVPEPPATTLTYDQSAQLMMDPTFRGRVKVAALSYATYINNEDPATAAHNSKMKWAAMCYNNPDIVAQTVANPVVMDPGVQQSGSAIDDTALQAAVQKVIDGMM